MGRHIPLHLYDKVPVSSARRSETFRASPGGFSHLEWCYRTLERASAFVDLTGSHACFSNLLFEDHVGVWSHFGQRYPNDVVRKSSSTDSMVLRRIAIETLERASVFVDHTGSSRFCFSNLLFEYYIGVWSHCGQMYPIVAMDRRSVVDRFDDLAVLLL